MRMSLSCGLGVISFLPLLLLLAFAFASAFVFAFCLRRESWAKVVVFFNLQ